MTVLKLTNSSNGGHCSIKDWFHVIKYSNLVCQILCIEYEAKQMR